MKSWKTSLAGIVALAAVVVTHFWPEHSPLVNKLMATAVALGLLSARDNNVTSKEAGVE